jgi:hypothetical protein
MGKPILVAGPSKLVYPSAVGETMIARCTITKSGTLRDCTILAGPSAMHQATLEMLSNQRYTPVYLHGKPVDVRYMLKLKLEALPLPLFLQGSPMPSPKRTPVGHLGEK